MLFVIIPVITHLQIQCKKMHFLPVLWIVFFNLKKMFTNLKYLQANKVCNF